MKVHDDAERMLTKPEFSKTEPLMASSVYAFQANKKSNVEVDTWWCDLNRPAWHVD
ncbi:hypothetical protein RESH_00127 [Rhodopirellula europaea SH398]|uniref:Uncharacterized protein n=1 Tax=Rhodopirellula europaea SH398 TaxID=1263868 RepID=M5SNQ0_9BACT|nr:hypothetical protein RESH_00127 [Rhodopirellula europaea SH398]